MLHHIHDPAAALRAVSGALLPGGTFLLGVYSAAGRAPLRAARRAAMARWPAAARGDAAALRACRAACVAARPGGADAALLSARESADLADLAGVRDLLFHPCEHEFDLPGAAVLAAWAGLRYVAIDRAARDANHGSEPATLRHCDFPTIDDWARLEADQPGWFGSMYHLLLHKPRPAPLDALDDCVDVSGLTGAVAALNGRYCREGPARFAQRAGGGAGGRGLLYRAGGGARCWHLSVGWRFAARADRAPSRGRLASNERLLGEWDRDPPHQGVGEVPFRVTAVMA